MKIKYFIVICEDHYDSTTITYYNILQKYESKDDEYIFSDIASNYENYIFNLEILSNLYDDDEYRDYLEDYDIEYIMPGYHKFNIAQKVDKFCHTHDRNKLTLSQVCNMMKPHYINDLDKFQKCLENMPNGSQIKFKIVDNLEKLYDMGFNMLKDKSVYS